MRGVTRRFETQARTARRNLRPQEARMYVDYRHAPANHLIMLSMGLLLLTEFDANNTCA